MSAPWLFLLAYACSGLAGLVYEVSWTRLATLYMGHTTAAASTVVAAFMGGLAAGSALGGSIAGRMTPRQALRAYAVSEAVVIVVALILPLELRALAPLLRWSYADGTGGVMFALMRLAASLLLFTIPAVAIGATFPFAVRWFVARSRAIGQLAGALYAANTLGAAVGSVGAGFLLLPSLGIFRTVLVAVAATALSIVVALTLWSRTQDEATATDSATADEGAARTKSRSVDGATRRQARNRTKARQVPAFEVSAQYEHLPLAATALALTGFATFVYEIAWTRLFALTAGPSTYAFSATLATVIAGIGLGSIAGSAIAARVRSAIVPLAVVLVGTAAVAAWATWFAGDGLPRAFAERLVREAASYAALQSERTWMMASLLGPLAFGLGVSFPLALQLTGGQGQQTPRRVGGVYALNTISAVAGSLLTGFILIPVLGLQYTLSLGTATLAAAALIVIAFSPIAGLTRLAIALPAAAALAWIGWQPAWDRELLASGVYKYARLTTGSVDVETELKAGTLLYYRDGAAATVSVKRLTGTLSLSVDGKVDASTGGDMLTQKTLAHLPLLLHASPERICIIGLGSGVTLASALVHPLKVADVVEISPQVVEASQLFDEHTHRPLADPRTHLIVGDGRTHLTLSRQQYDVIISEPSNPWMAGVAALFTREFLTATKARLAPGGILCQWAHTYNIGDQDLRSIVATFAEVFPDGTMWLMGDGDLLLIGSRDGDLNFANIASHWYRPGVAADLRTVSAYEPFEFLASYIAGPDEMRQYAAVARPESDDRMALEFSAPRALYGSDARQNVVTLRKLLDVRRAPEPIASAWRSADAVQRRHRAELMLKADAHEAAYEDYAAALDLDAMDPQAPAGLVRAAVPARRQADAVTRLERAGRAHPDAVAVWIALSKLHASMGVPDGAVAAARQASAIEPTRVEALEQLASVYSDLGDAPGLNGTAETLRHFFPDSRSAHYYTAAAQFLGQDLSAAARSIQRAIGADSRYAPAHNLAGAIQASQGNVAQARAAFRVALTLDPRDPTIYANLGLLELSHGQPAAAAQLFAEALTIDPASPAARQGLLDAQRSMN